MAKKTITILLVLLMLLPLMTAELAVPASAAQTDLETTIEQQIRAYADSIDQPGADDDAARVIAMHGILMGGRTMYADENDALTATILNSEFALDTLVGSCEAIIRQMQLTGDPELYGDGNMIWNSDRKERSLSVNYLLDYFSDDFSQKHGICDAYRFNQYMGPTNGYDATLEWVVGAVQLDITVTRVAVTKEQATYKVGVCFYDQFDFDPNNSASVPSAIASLLGSAMFREFTWYSNVELELTVPYSCDHAAGVYHWELNPDTGNLDADTTGVFVENTAETHVYATGNYYKLARTVRLYHHQPWVMEYTIRGENNLLFSVIANHDNSFPMLLHGESGDFYVGMRDRKPNNLPPWDLYGVSVKSEESEHTYTYRLENVLKTDGSNMVCLTVYDQTTQQTLVDAAPLNNYYTGTDEKITDKKKTDNWVAGEDLYINYIGVPEFALDADAFSLKIYENGVDDNFIDTQNVNPTCTTPGGVRHTCAACGYTYYTNATSSTGHSWGSYKSNNDATCQHDGTKTAVCTTCGEEDTVPDPGSKTDHNWIPATCLYPETCLDCGETRGETIEHNWLDATCTDPKTCTMCGLTEGEALGHDWTGVTCEHANTCKVCGLVVGEPKDHTWVDATCTKAKHCAFCGITEGKPSGHKWTGGSCTTGPTCKNCGAKGKAPGHNWTGGSCTEPQHCNVCGAEGTLLDHTWTAADCNSARSCAVCGFADGEALGHDWVEATCTDAKYCARCGLTEGEPLGHDWMDATCQNPKTCARCALTEGDPADHPWLSATCDAPKTCPTCGITEGAPLAHAWTDATCHDPKTCTLCGLAEGETLDHVWTDGDCTHGPTCELCAEARTAPGHAWLNADCESPRTCAICNIVEGKALGHPDSNENSLCDRCGEKLNTVAIQPQPVFDWWPIAAIAALVILGVIDFFVVRDYRRAKAGYYE